MDYAFTATIYPKFGSSAEGSQRHRRGLANRLRATTLISWDLRSHQNGLKQERGLIPIGQVPRRLDN
jgi:hypothetical protein